MKRFWIFDFGFWTQRARCCALPALLLCMQGCDKDQPSPSGKSAPVADASTAAQDPKSKPQVPSILFTDVTANSGIDMVMRCGDPDRPVQTAEILEVNGGGFGLIDFDNDGDLDLFVANGATLDDPDHGPGCRLYENLGNLRFRDVTSQSGIEIHRWAMGVAVGDYDGDGLDDLFVACYGPDVLLHNTGGGRFVDVTEAAGIDRDQTGIPTWGTSAAFGDVDGDGDLDLYVCNYLEFDTRKRPPHAQYKGVEVMAGPHGLTPQHDFLYENLGNGTFKDITEVSGCLAAKPSFGLNVVILDFDNDGKQDIVVNNDSMPGFYFRNIGLVDGHARFEEIGIISGIASNSDGINQAAMGIGIADVDGNGLPDKFTTVFSSDTNSLHMNINGKLFEDRSQQYGLAQISRPYLGWSCGFFDFDHDGDEDLFMVNGHVYPNATLEHMDSEYLQTPLLFERAGKRFNRIKPEGLINAWLAEKHRDRNAVFADFDNDGDIDIIIGGVNEHIRVLRNDLAISPDSPNWLIVQLDDNRPLTKNHRAFGSKIELSARDSAGNPMKQTRWLFTGAGYQSSGAPYVHFALPPGADASSAQLHITWPDGHAQDVQNVKLGQHLIVRPTP